MALYMTLSHKEAKYAAYIKRAAASSRDVSICGAYDTRNYTSAGRALVARGEGMASAAAIIL